MLASIGHTKVVVVELCMHLVGVEVKVLCAHRWREGADGFERCAPQSRHHVDGKRQGSQRKEEARNAYLSIVIVVWELNLTQQVEGKQGEEGYPNGEEGFAIEDAPAISQIGHREELQREGKLYEAKGNLNNIHPSTRLRHALKPCGEESKQGEGQRQSDGKSKHTNGGCKDASTGAKFY